MLEVNDAYLKVTMHKTKLENLYLFNFLKLKIKFDKMKDYEYSRGVRVFMGGL